MSTPLLILLAGSNGAGKSTLAEEVLIPATRLPFVNADVLAEEQWPGDRKSQQSGAAEVSELAAQIRTDLIAQRASFITETVFSHPSKVELVRQAQAAGYQVWLHVVLIPEELAVERVADRVDDGGHHVPETKIRQRYQRLWTFVAQAARLADQTVFHDNSSLDDPLRPIATFHHGSAVGVPQWPLWTPPALLELSPT